MPREKRPRRTAVGSRSSRRKAEISRINPDPTTATVELMTMEQAKLLKQLAQETYEPQAFKPNLTQAEAARRIATLRAKLKLLGEPPHTL
jgi:Protein of unknown function (DUF3072)